MEKEIQTINNATNLVIEFFINYSFQILGGIIIVFIGFYVAKRLAIIVEEFCLKKELDVTLTRFISSAIKIAIITGAIIIALGKVGITITPFVAAIGAMSLGAGLALQGMLSNYGAGVAIIASRPFVVGNTITLGDYSGVVKVIKLAYTVLVTEDNEEITIPNKEIVGRVLVNSFEFKVVETIVGISYDNDPQIAIEAIIDILESDSNISTKLKPMVGIKEFGDFSINLELRYWVPTIKYHEIQYDINNKIYKILLENNINIPYPTYNVINKG